MNERQDRESYSQQRSAATTMGATSRRLERLLAAEELVRNQRDFKLHLSSSLSNYPNHIWREKVAQWFYDVTDHLGERRSIVYVAMNILDRYCIVLSQQDGSAVVNERIYEVLSITSLFLAVRTTGSDALKIQDLLNMSSNGVTVKEVVERGTHMIKALTWDNRVPTPFDFVTSLLDHLPPTSRRTTIIDAAAYLIELSVCDLSLSHCKASDVALAAVMNSWDQESDVQLFSRTLKNNDALTLDPTSQSVASLRTRLQLLYGQSYENRQESGPHVIIASDDVEEAITTTPSDCCFQPARTARVSDPDLSSKKQYTIETADQSPIRGLPRTTNRRSLIELPAAKRARI